MLECDYLVVGAGASGLAFADAIISESPDRTLILIDKLLEPGGHWNHAYDFVKLHQPACYYGVASEKLERPGDAASYRYKDLSSKREILSYFRMVLDKMLRTGRVKYFGGCTYDPDDDANRAAEARAASGEGPTSFIVHSFTDSEGTSQTVQVKRRLVDATYQKIQVPSTRPPKYHVHKGVNIVPVNGINGMTTKPKKVVLIGAGKTGVDAALYLLDDVGMSPEDITWIVPRDCWFYHREFFRPRDILSRVKYFFDSKATLEESILQKEADGMLLRMDPSVWPEKFSGATIEPGEIERLREIGNVIRKGRVASVTTADLIMESGDRIRYDKGALVVDCSAPGIPTRPIVPIFQPFKIVLQPVTLFLICISAATTGYIECHADFHDDDDRNRLMEPVPYPTSTEDSLGRELRSIHNRFQGAGSDPRTQGWHDSCRLNVSAHSSMWTLVRGFGGGFYYAFRSLPQSLDTKKAQYQQIHQEDFPLSVYSSQKMEKLIQFMRMTMVIFHAVLLGGLVLFLRFVSRSFPSDVYLMILAYITPSTNVD